MFNTHSAGHTRRVPFTSSRLKVPGPVIHGCIYSAICRYRKIAFPEHNARGEVRGHNVRINLAQKPRRLYTEAAGHNDRSFAQPIQSHAQRPMEGT